MTLTLNRKLETRFKAYNESKYKFTQTLVYSIKCWVIRPND